MYLAKINPTTLAITLQNHFSSATAYLNPEIQPVYTTSGTMILMSGNASFVNTSNPGYVHLFFSPATLAFNQGTLYNTTSSGFVNTAIFDTYTGTAPGFNIFTIASDQTTTTNYYLLKTSELGHDACDTPYNITPGTCTIDHFAIPFTKIFVPATFPHLKKFATKSYANKSIQSCLVSCPGCAISTDNGTSDNNENENKEMVVASSQTEGIKIYPNPAKEMITIESDNALENARLSVYNLLGEKIMDTQMEGTVKTIDISGFNSGIYFVHILVEDEQKIFRVIKQ
ncbi:MAG: T9SS type A sorting domain-containing protein [Bacteroidia bacterium]